MPTGRAPERCPECCLLGGRHQARCRYPQRTRRPRRPAVYDLVTADHLIALFNAYHAKAVRLVRHFGGLTTPEAEDVVSDVFLYLWKNRAVFSVLPGRADLFTAVKHGAQRHHLYAWVRHVVPMDPADLVVAEQRTCLDSLYSG